MLDPSQSLMLAAAIAALLLGATAIIRPIWKEYKRGRRKERRRDYDLKESAIERGYSVSQTPGGYSVRAPHDQP